ncbi:hypothetical protein NTD84_19125 [Pseudomonas sp. 14P_8.1_Bac3]|uniref:hypothetical protein n=1 Tax=Pseudomonas sp. 14P_8.1_Bac3 TaxID=2971621 RepID=UPI0021C79786|nr:hypothetical protein [Pseudomonas sp. 14P_8.1_Bac3]MCU1761819.1 hypothetical protein [Pseudomonas sp. 14P_8.1_Bac3]
MSNTRLILGWFNAIVFLGILGWFCFVFYMAHTTLTLILNLLKDCPSVKALSRNWDAGPRAKFRLITSISAIVTFPRFHSKAFELSSNDLSSLPVSIKRKLVFMQWSIWALLALAGLLWAAGKIAGWHD